MEGDLNKPVGQAPMVGLRRGMRDIGTQIRALWKQATRNRPTIEAKLGRLETKIDALIKGEQGNGTGAGRQTPTTWANIAALPPRAESAPIAQRPAICVRIPGAAEKTPEEILTAVKPVIMGAYAIKQLHSGDVEVMVPDQWTKDRALNQQQTEGVKILRQDYPVEVRGVPPNHEHPKRKRR